MKATIHDFTKDVRGIPYQIINGTRQFLAPEWFAPDGRFLGPNPNSRESHGSVLHNGMRWNTQKGVWENPINVGNLIGIGTAATIGGFGAGAALSGAGAPGGSFANGGAGLFDTAAAPSVAGTGGPTLGSLFAGQAIPAAISGVSNLFAQRSANNANSRAAQLQSEAANHAADLQAQANAEQLAFLKQQEAERQKEWQSTQDTNMGLFREREGRLQPYRDFGRRSLGQLLQPIPRGNSLGSLMGTA